MTDEELLKKIGLSKDSPLSEVITQPVYEHKLTKAKELLNMFLRLHYSPIVDEKTLFDKVENFLKDSEVEK